MDLFSLKGKTAVVIGGASGIGEAVAHGCARQGAQRRPSRHQAGGGRRASRALDIRDSAARRSRVRARSTTDARRPRHRRSARRASTCASRSWSTHDDELARVLDLNIKGNFNVLRAAGRVMTARKQGSIVLFSSIRSQVVEPGQARLRRHQGRHRAAGQRRPRRSSARTASASTPSRPASSRRR